MPHGTQQCVVLVYPVPWPAMIWRGYLICNKVTTIPIGRPETRSTISKSVVPAPLCYVNLYSPSNRSQNTVKQAYRCCNVFICLLLVLNTLVMFYCYQQCHYAVIGNKYVKIQIIAMTDFDLIGHCCGVGSSYEIEDVYPHNAMFTLSRI